MKKSIPILLSALCALSLGLNACGGGGSGDGDAGDGDGDAGDGDGDVGPGGSGNEGTTCEVEDNGDGTATITCTDGNEVTVEANAVGDDCSVDAETDGSFTIACDGEDPLVVVPQLDYEASLVISGGRELFLTHVGENGIERASISPSDAAGDVGNFKMSPSGDMVAFTYRVSADEPFDLYVADVSERVPGAPEKVNGEWANETGGFVDFGFYHDGTLWYWADEDTAEMYEIYHVPFTDGAPDPSFKLNHELTLGGTASRSVAPMKPDGTAVLYHASPDQLGHYELYFKNLAEDDAPVKVNGTLPEDGTIGFAGFLRDDRLAVYLQVPDIAAPTFYDFFMSDVSTGVPKAPHKLNETRAEGDVISKAAFSRSAEWFAYAFKTGSGTTVKLVDISGDSPEAPVPTDFSGGATTEISSLFFSNDSSTLVAVGDLDTDNQVEIFSLDVSSGTPSSYKTISTSLTSTQDVGTVILSPDGDWLVYTVIEEEVGDIELHAVKPDGSDAVELDLDLTGGLTIGEPIFSLFSDHLVVTLLDEGTEFRAYSIDLTGAEPAEPVPGPEAGPGEYLSSCKLSRSGTFLACNSEESGILMSGVGDNVVNVWGQAVFQHAD